MFKKKKITINQTLKTTSPSSHYSPPTTTIPPFHSTAGSLASGKICIFPDLHLSQKAEHLQGAEAGRQAEREGTPARKDPQKNPTPTVPDDQEPNADCLCLWNHCQSLLSQGMRREARTKVSAWVRAPQRDKRGAREGRSAADRKRFCFYVSPNAKGSSRLGPVRIFKLCPNGSHTPGQRPSDPEGTLALGGVWCVTSNILASFWAVSQVCLLGLSMSSPHTDLRKCTEDIVLALLTLK